MQSSRIFLGLSFLFAGAATATALGACSDGNDGISAYDGGSKDSGASDAAATSDGTVRDSGAGGSGKITLNEISGKGDEWVEIANIGDAPIDLHGYSLTDGDKDGGAPKTSDALVFPAQTILAPGEFLVAAKQPADAGAVTCPGKPRLCFAITFGISNKDGDVIHLLGPTNETVAYPAATLLDGETWSRLPSGTGNFGRGKATPNAANSQ
jgi:hypothetical protein